MRANPFKERRIDLDTAAAYPVWPSAEYELRVCQVGRCPNEVIELRFVHRQRREESWAIARLPATAAIDLAGALQDLHYARIERSGDPDMWEPPGWYVY
jgi:hypothetical protein